MSNFAKIYCLIIGIFLIAYIGLLFTPVEIKYYISSPPYQNAYVLAAFVFVFPVSILHLIGLILLGVSLNNTSIFLSLKFDRPKEPGISRHGNKAVIFGLIGCILASLGTFLAFQAYSGFAQGPTDFSLFFFIPILAILILVSLARIIPHFLNK